MRAIVFAVAFTMAGMISAGQALAARVTADLNMRSGPSTRYARIAVIPAGREVDVVQCQGGWCSVQFRGIVGWVSGRYLAQGGGYYRPGPYYNPAPPPPVYYYPRAPYSYYPRYSRVPYYYPRRPYYYARRPYAYPRYGYGYRYPRTWRRPGPWRRY
jgi:uncharacterized protein YraI